MKRGFTLLELVIVVILVGILATLGFVQYTAMLEKGRKAEARSILGTLRQLEAVKYLETGAYSDLANLSTGVPDASCAATHFFSYACSSTNGTCTGTRCVSGGKTPDAPSGFNYTVSLDINGTFSGTGEWQ